MLGIDALRAVGVLLFTPDPDILAYFSIVKGEDSHDITFPLHAPFALVLLSMKEAWDRDPFDELRVQDPDTIVELTDAFRLYVKAPFPPEPLLAKKVATSRKFYRYLERRFTKTFGGTLLTTVDVPLESYIRSAATGELFPPSVLMTAGEAATRDARTLQIDANVTRFAEESRRGLPPHGCLRAPRDGELIPCPSCLTLNYLQGWQKDQETLGLCYYCGTVFIHPTRQVLAVLTGARTSWLASAIKTVLNAFLKSSAPRTRRRRPRRRRRKPP